jgi:hypothetical protein
MRLLLLLVVLAMIGLTLARWLGEKPAAARVPPAASNPTAAPAAPTRPQELKQFERDLNRFMQDTATQRGRQADPP